VLLLGKPILEDCKREHANFRDQLNAFEATVEKASWKTPIDLKSTLPSADQVGEFYVIDVGGKKGIRVIIVVQFVKQTVLIERIFTDHDAYQKWSIQTKAEHDRVRKRKKKTPESKKK
jgi:mRNA interferase HigB